MGTVNPDASGSQLKDRRIVVQPGGTGVFDDLTDAPQIGCVMVAGDGKKRYISHGLYKMLEISEAEGSIDVIATEQQNIGIDLQNLLDMSLDPSPAESVVVQVRYIEDALPCEGPEGISVVPDLNGVIISYF